MNTTEDRDKIVKDAIDAIKKPQVFTNSRELAKIASSVNYMMEMEADMMRLMNFVEILKTSGKEQNLVTIVHGGLMNH